jgi:hypothetical protein
VAGPAKQDTIVAKFHIKLKVQGLELEVEGSREDMPVIRRALTQQVAGLFQPGTHIVDGETSTETLGASAAQTTEAVKHKGRKPRSTSVAGSGADVKEPAVDWIHDSGKHGSPLQIWSNTKKAIWLLYVVSKQADVSELSCGRITATFNKHFRQAGQVNRGNLYRDLGKAKSATKGRRGLVSEDTTKTPPTWFLTEAGTKMAEGLVVEALGPVEEQGG